ncbi:hypothetical protein ACETIH_21230 [Microvirga arabica]|uniref:Uncharacterized protein n=1 Tax=Microvirga arabica TaxID=1128671 RepID=A0ABV6YD37_9HYPH
MIAASANSLPSQLTFFLMGHRCTQAINTTEFIGGAGGQTWTPQREPLSSQATWVDQFSPVGT